MRTIIVIFTERKLSLKQYAGVVYFKNQEDAIKAVKILGKRVKSLFD